MKRKKQTKPNQKYLSYGIIAVVILVVLIILTKMNGGYLKTQVITDTPLYPEASPQMVTDDTPLDPYPFPSEIGPIEGACYGFGGQCNNGATEEDCQDNNGAFDPAGRCLPNPPLFFGRADQLGCFSWNSASRLEEATNNCLGQLQNLIDNHECPGSPIVVAGPTIVTDYSGNLCTAHCRLAYTCTPVYASTTPSPENSEPIPNTTASPLPS